ncbi:uncharacterized protein P884DRAFT_289759 [Thermothelomyces heterothallicus CBS 202.75]|uniref:uncharacterized protein n=1 Tax=Thermothelomyces heterothallicus CBS 202.75 TaxID=1149848 RepID=UPI0037424D01
MLSIVLIIATAIQLAVALPIYKIPPALSKVAHKSNFCILPQEFVIKNFQIWNPQADNNHSTTINFDYLDDSVMPAIDTKCHLNQTSVNVGAKSLVPRYACDDALVEFMWTNGTLTVIERACPQETLTRPHEATGVLKPKFNCLETIRNSTIGPGFACSSTPDVILGAFVSLRPTLN